MVTGVVLPFCKYQTLSQIVTRKSSVKNEIMMSDLYTLLTMFSNRTGEVMVCVLDFKRKAGLWHGVLTVSDCSHPFILY